MNKYIKSLIVKLSVVLSIYSLPAFAACPEHEGHADGACPHACNCSNAMQNDKATGAVNNPRQTLVNLATAEQQSRGMAAPERAKTLLAIGAEARKRSEDKIFVSHAYLVLSEAYALASSLESRPLRSMIYGEFAALYEDNGHLADAKRLTEQALLEAQAAGSDALLMKWDWQLGRLLRREGDINNAIVSYRRAVQHIEAIRHDLPVTYQDGKSSFRETLAPIYFGLADMLLEQAGKSGTEKGSERQALLREAQNTVELIKRSEMQDYFHDRCIASKSRTVESVSSSTAVLYPILLSDRLELLVDIGGSLHQKTSYLNRKELENACVNFSKSLRSGGFSREASLQLYNWLVAPVRNLLDENKADTLVFAPDGAMRLVPASTLWDGSHFLVENYAIVTTPGLTLLDPTPLPRGEVSTLLAGMSTPGPVVFDLPPRLLNAAIRQGETRQLGDQVRGISIESGPLQPDNASTQSDTGSFKGDMEKVKQALALPGVSKEIEELSRTVGGEALLDEDFKLARFSDEITKRPFRVVHIASHGYFGGSPEQNFIMTYDKRMDMNTLENLIKPKQFVEQPVEMLTLSACQTAEGDDRSPLGLSGIALKSGARSALGTLWPVSDDAAQVLLPAFYANLKDAKVSKAAALKQAQTALLQKKGFENPFYWGPFILVGNWL